MPDPWSAAWEEAEATAPPNVLVHNTLELQHPTFDQPARVVAGVPDDMNFTLEAGATPNGGESVLFQACEFWAEYPEVAEGKPPECRVSVDNVARLLVPALNNAVATRADLIAIWRQYRSDDLTEPCFGPVQFNVRRVTMTGTRIQGVARIDDLVNKKFPSRVYTIKDFPGLQG